MDLKGRDFLALKDYSPEEIAYLIDLAARLKKLKKERKPHRLLEGYQAALIFEKTSTRTRCAFETAAFDLGMHTTYLNSSSSQLGKKESIADTARVLSRMYDGIEYRGFGQSKVETLAEYSDVPVWNGLTNEFHPTQMLADLLTIKEHFPDHTLKGKKLVYMGDARYNTGNSLMIACAKMGMNFTALTNHHYFPDMALVTQAQKIAKETDAYICLTESMVDGLKGADIVYTDVWVSMGEPEEVWAERIHALSPFRVTTEVMQYAGPDTIFMHCLPAFHDTNTEIGKKIYDAYGLKCLEVEDEVFESPASVVFDEAENRMHTIKAVMLATLADEKTVGTVFNL